MSSEPAIVLDAVWKRFRRGQIHDSLRDLVPALTGRLLHRRSTRQVDDFWALREVSFQVAPGDAIGIIGPNGAGKSTILKILSRIMRPERGRAWVNGRLSSLIEIGAGFHFDLTGRENIYLNGAILGMSRREMARKFDAIVDFAELADFIDTPIKRYSSGMHARLGFSVAAHMDPDVLLVDEVLSVGDYHFQTKCLERMREFIASGVTVVFVSHNMNAVGALCSRCVLLEDGRVQYLGDAAQAIQKYYARGRRRDSGEGEPHREVWVESSRLTEESGQRAAVFKNGQRAALRVRLGSNIDAKVSVGLVLQSTSGVVIADTATTRLTNEMVELRAGGRCEVEFQFSIRFCPGTYLLTVNVEDPLLRRYHTFARNLESFAVSDGEGCSGICFIEPTVAVRQSVGDQGLAGGMPSPSACQTASPAVCGGDRSPRS